MKFGFPLLGVRLTDYPKVARSAEAAGFESIWMPEHLVFPAEMPSTYPYAESNQPPVSPGIPIYDAWVSLAFVAAQTERIRLGTHVYILPLRHPLVTARAFTTLDVLSEGRANLGIGVGWLEDEFNIVGESFRTRGKRTDEIIAVLKTLWREKVVEHHGEFYDLPPLRFEPKPVQKPHPPIEVGGTTAPAIRRAARLGDGWLATGLLELDELQQLIKQLHAQRREAGRDNGPFDVSMTNRLSLDVDSMRRYEDIGVTRVMLSPPFDRRLTTSDFVDFLDRCGDEIVSKMAN